MEEMIYSWWVFLYKKRYSRKGNHLYGICTNSWYAKNAQDAVNMLVARLQKRNIPYNDESIIGVTKQTSENSKEFRKTLKEWLQK
jgi:flavodoxin